MKRIIVSIVLTLGLVVAASAQTGKSLQFSNAPTDTDYRLTIIEPKAGATIVGKDFNIVLGLPTVPPGNKEQSSAQDLKQRDMNTPIFQIWIDGKNMGNLPGGTNVFFARDLSYGPHKIVVMAKNASGELVDRKELSVTNVETAGSVAVTQSKAPAPEPAPALRVVESAPAPAQVTAPEPPVQSYATLPHTATAFPLAATVGFLLLGAGIAMRRKG